MTSNGWHKRSPMGSSVMNYINWSLSLHGFSMGLLWVHQQNLLLAAGKQRPRHKSQSFTLRPAAVTAKAKGQLTSRHREALPIGCVWKCCVPLNPMVLLIIIPFLNGYNWEYTLFPDKPIFFPAKLVDLAIKTAAICYKNNWCWPSRLQRDPRGTNGADQAAGMPQHLGGGRERGGATSLFSSWWNYMKLPWIRVAQILGSLPTLTLNMALLK